MKNLNAITKYPEVLGVAVSDMSGALLECAGHIDGEMEGAVHAFTARALGEAGELLGLSAFERASVTCVKAACLIAAIDGEVVGVNVDPTKPFGISEKKILDVLLR